MMEVSVYTYTRSRPDIQRANSHDNVEVNLLRNCVHMEKTKPACEFNKV